MEISISFNHAVFALIIAVYLGGLILALMSVFESRTPQGTMAWMLSLTFIPFISIPIFLLCGKRKIDDYQMLDNELIEIKNLSDASVSSFKEDKRFLDPDKLIFEERSPFLKGNSIDLLVNGDEIFPEMISSIKLAKKYIFLQMYIFRTDEIGSLIIDSLIQKSLEGVEVYILYEKIRINMSEKHLRDMRKSGIHLGEFSPIKINKLQFNFRNHRKLLIIDGVIGFFGGINIGDDYLGRYPHIGFWRDSNLKISGPILNLAQFDFIKDWRFSQKYPITVDLNFCNKSFGESRILFLSTSPDEERPINLLQHIELILMAKKRLWIANPYVIPPQGLIDALTIASMKGVDVRIIIPKNNDSRLVSLAMEFQSELLVTSGIKLYKFTPGMMHQKIILVDDKLAMVGTSNLDFRSMLVNFENTIITDDQELIKNLDLCFREDFKKSQELDDTYFSSFTIYRRLAARLVNSVAPIL